MIREIRAPMDKYSELELNLGAKRAEYYVDYNLLKNRVVSTDMRGIICQYPRHQAVSERLGLGDRDTKALGEIYENVVYPLEKAYLQAKGVLLCLRDIKLGENGGLIVAVPRSEKMEMAIYDFTARLATVIKEEQIEDKENIKSVIVYPIIITQISMLRKHNSYFGGRMIDSITAREPDPNMKAIIEELDFNSLKWTE